MALAAFCAASFLFVGCITWVSEWEKGTHAWLGFILSAVAYLLIVKYIAESAF